MTTPIESTLFLAEAALSAVQQIDRADLPATTEPNGVRMALFHSRLSLESLVRQVGESLEKGKKGGNVERRPRPIRVPRD